MTEEMIEYFDLVSEKFTECAHPGWRLVYIKQQAFKYLKRPDARRLRAKTDKIKRSKHKTARRHNLALCHELSRC
jgi:hypothetical protein